MITFNKINENAIIPQYAHPGDAGLDFYSVEDTMIGAGETVIVKTGLRCSFPAGNVLIITGKSGIDVRGILAKVARTTFVHDDDTDLTTIYIDENKAIRVKMGVVDCNYRGEIGIIVKNEDDETITIPKGIKIAQGILFPIPKISNEDIIEINEEAWNKLLEEEDNARGEGGFGSSGIK